MLRLLLNLHFFQSLLVSLVILLGLAGHCLPVQSWETDKKHKKKRKRGHSKNYVRVDMK